MSSTRRLLTGVLSVLAIAAVAFVLRGLLDGTDSTTSKLPPIAGVVNGPKTETSTQQFRLGDLTRNIIPKGASTIATAKKRSVQIYAEPRSKTSKKLKQRVFNGQRIPLAFLVRSRRKGWVQVDLPTRPNQSTGWIRRPALRLSFTQLKLEVQAKKHRLRLVENGKLVFTRKIAVGASLSPTPPGRYYVTDVIRASNPKGFFGPYALGLSAHSNVYTSFEGGDGQVGLHGTNQPSALGSDVSHGCIRVANSVIRYLAKRVPIGTPVIIER